MPYITREDGEHFVIPSYRDVLTVKQKSQLKKEVLLLSQSYGEYITLQKKSANQYEVAFSPDTGYLLGESIWHYFKKPADLIYCEAIPDTTEAILVIVKSGSVYLDGRFPVESIPEELIIFLTQQNNFEIYLYGDVPVSETPEPGKFSFEISSVKSFTILDKPVFPSLPLLKIYQLQLVDPVLRAHGIGAFPTRQLIIFVVFAALAYMGYSYFAAKRQQVVVKREEVNPYQLYLTTLNSPAPDQEIVEVMKEINVLSQIPGWEWRTIKYSSNSITATVTANGGTMETLFNWCSRNKVAIQIRKTGIVLTVPVQTTKRPMPTTINDLNKVVGAMIDRLQVVYPGNNMDLSEFVPKGVFSQVEMRISFRNISPALLLLISRQFAGLPLVLRDITLNLSNSTLSGTITLNALGKKL